MTSENLPIKEVAQRLTVTLETIKKAKLNDLVNNVGVVIPNELYDVLQKFVQRVADEK